jgi:hypothetical protein
MSEQQLAAVAAELEAIDCRVAALEAQLALNRGLLEAIQRILEVIK